MKNELTGIIGCALASVAAHVIVNLIVYQSSFRLVGSAVIGLFLGTVIGTIVSTVGSHRPVFAGLTTTIVVYGGILTFLAAMSVTAIHSAFDLLMVALTVVFFGLANGFGYRALGPSRD